MGLAGLTVIGQRGPGIEPGQQGPPMLLGLGLVLLAQPAQVVPERAPGHQLRYPALGDRRVLLADLTEYRSHAPAIEDHVVVGPEQQDLALGHSCDHQPQQWRHTRIHP